MEKLGQGVFALIRDEPPGLLPEGNSVFLLDDEGAVVVDTNLLLSSAQQALAALRELTAKPVRAVINTHWHDDHVTGNQIYLDAFPGLDIIAHATARDDLAELGLPNRQRMLKDGPAVTAKLRRCLETGKNLAGAAMTAGERAAFQSDVAIFDEYVAQASRFRLTPPNLTFDDRVTLHRPGREIELRFVGRGHSRGDVVVWLPRERILLAGDLAARPVIVGDKSFLADWIATLEKLRALQPALVVPGHGAVQRDDSYLKLLGAMLASVKQQVDAAVARGEKLEQTRKSVQLDSFRKEVAGDDAELGFLFANYFSAPAVTLAFKEASAKR